ncbi:MAG: FAD-dependent monooxygenase [Actinobacteria bacterium]|nr:FAD-dependent monooxygenase [Actinomycetota bacterium]
MRIAVLGGGPAGLYLAALAMRADPSHDITVIERNPPDATFGWGVVFSEETLGEFREADPKSYEEITESFVRWDAIDVRYRGETVRVGGQAFSAIARKELLGILQRRCAELGVALEFERELTEEDVRGLAGEVDLLVAADGVNSTARRVWGDELGSSIDPRSTRYVWFGTDFGLRAFTFSFRESEHGLFQAHAYPFDATTSTFIVETREEVWQRAGLDRASDEESIAFCEALFAEDLEGHRLLSNRSLWFNFLTVKHDTWHAGNVAFMGDAVHTAHFTIGSGTKLAMEDAISLAGAIERCGGDPARLEQALTYYELERQPAVERLQEAARESQTYFENVDRYAGFEPVQFAFNLLTRSGRIGHGNLALRDPGFVARVDAWFAERARAASGAGAAGQGVSATSPVQTSGERTPPPRRIAPPPMFAPIRLGSVLLPNRAVQAPVSTDAAVDGMPGEAHAGQLAEALTSGAGLVITEMLAVSPEGRTTAGSAGLYLLEHARTWERLLARVRGELSAAGGPPVGVAAQIGHAGRRGSSRPRREGLDRPLAVGNWPLVSASALTYAPWSRFPRELLPEELPGIREAFARAARWAGEAGFDVLEVNMAQGYLLAAFLSPLANERRDAYGGSPEGRLRFPLEVVEAVREAWPADRPLVVRLVAEDRHRRGLSLDEGVTAARALADRGCDVVHVHGGWTVPETRPEYRRFHLVPASDRIRNEAGVPTMVGGRIVTRDDASTILAAGRADLCVLDLPPP